MSLRPRPPRADRTGLIGIYCLKLEATPEYRFHNPEDSDLSIFTAMGIPAKWNAVRV